MDPQVVGGLAATLVIGCHTSIKNHPVLLRRARESKLVESGCRSRAPNKPGLRKLDVQHVCNNVEGCNWTLAPTGVEPQRRMLPVWRVAAAFRSCWMLQISQFWQKSKWDQRVYNCTPSFETSFENVLKFFLTQVYFQKKFQNFSKLFSKYIQIFVYNWALRILVAWMDQEL
jgi:hypothetical protein